MLVILLFSVVALVILIWIAYSYFGSRAEHLGYQVLDKSKEYEVRKLDDYLVAETSIKGDFGTAGNRAFNILAGYIFGNNKKRQKIAMTTPVIEAESEKIAMTTPVISEEAGNNKKNVSFVLPSKYKMDNVPEPNDERVTLRAVKNRQVAVLRFRGISPIVLFLKKEGAGKVFNKRRREIRYNFFSPL